MQVVTQYPSNNARTTNSSRQSRRRARACMMGVAIAGAFAMRHPNAQAADIAWSSTPGSNIWSTTAPNWSGSTSWVNAPNNGAVFNTSTSNSISVTEAVSASSLEFQVSGYTISNAAGGSLTFGSGLSTLSGYSGSAIASGGFSGIVDVAQATNNTTITNTAEIDAPITSTVGFKKEGSGLLILGGPLNITGSYPLTGDFSYSTGANILEPGFASLTSNLAVGATSPNGTSPAGTYGGILRLNSNASLPATTSVSVGDGILDLGSQNFTIAGLTFANQNYGAYYGTWVPQSSSESLIGGYSNGVIGTGMLTVNGDINVILAGNAKNTIQDNLNVGAGTQVIRLGSSSTSAGLLISGNLSGTGALTVVPGYNTTGGIVAYTSQYGNLGLFGNNANTGPMTFDTGVVSITGNNATGKLTVANSSLVQLMGANGSLGSVSTINVTNNGTLAILNDTAYTTVGAGNGSAAAANNQNRINDSANIVMRDATFVYNGSSTALSSETYGSLNVSSGYNTLKINTTNTNQSSVVLTATNSLTIGRTATLLISTVSPIGQADFADGYSPVVQHTFGSVIDAATGTDYTTTSGPIPRVISYDSTSGNYNLVTYAPGVGLQTDIAPTSVSDASTNYSVNNFNGGDTYVIASVTGNGVAIGGIGSGTINSLTLTHSNSYSYRLGFASGSTLNISSGMIVVNKGTPTFQGSGTGTSDATINFGTATGVIAGNSTSYNLINWLPLTGTGGLVVSGPGLWQYGSLANLSGGLTVNNPSTSSNQIVELFEGSVANGSASTYCIPGAINIRSGMVAINTNTAIAGYYIEPTGLGDVNLGEPENDSNLLNSYASNPGPSAILNTAGTSPGITLGGSVFTRNINFNNGGGTNAGAALTPGLTGYFPEVIVTSTGVSQTLTGNINLYSPGRFYGGSLANAYNSSGPTFSGNISGGGTLEFDSGTYNLTGNLQTTGPIWIGAGGAANVSFKGSAYSTSTSPIIGWSSGTSSYFDTLAYSGQSSLPNSSITINNVSATGVSGNQNNFDIEPLQTATISNPININGDLTFNAPAGVVGTWSGLIAGTSTLYVGGGNLVPTNTGNTFGGAVKINGSSAVLTLANGTLHPSSITVIKGILAATGTLTAPLNVSGGTLYPGYGQTTSAVSLTLPSNASFGSTSTIAVNLTGLSGTNGINDQITFTAAPTFSGLFSAINTNIPVASFAVGDIFQIFNYGGFSVTGAFAQPLNLPILGPGEVWNTAALYAANGGNPAGTLSIVAGINSPDAWSVATSGNWDTTDTNWSIKGYGAPGGTGTTEVFGDAIGTGSATVTLVSPESSGLITFNGSQGGSYTLTGASLTMYNRIDTPAAINVSMGSQTINSNISYGAPGLNINTGGGSLVLGGALTGPGPLNLSGAVSSSGNINVSGAVSITGGLSSAGSLNLSGPVNIAVFGTFSSTGSLNLSGGLIGSYADTLNFSGSGAKYVSAFNLSNNTAVNVLSGSLTAGYNAAAGSVLNVSNGATFTTPTALNLLTNTFNISGSLVLTTSLSPAFNSGSTVTVNPGGSISLNYGYGTWSFKNGSSLVDNGIFAAGTATQAETIYFYPSATLSIGPGAGASFLGNPTLYNNSTATIAGATSGSTITPVFMKALTMNNGSAGVYNSSTLTLTPSSASANRTLLVLGSSSSTLNGTIDLGNGDMADLAATGATGLAKMWAQVQLGYNGGAWNGTNISNGSIGSSAAASDPTHLHALGVILNDVGLNTTGTATGTAIYSNFDQYNRSSFQASNPLINTDVLIKYTYYGDANLDGTVNSADYTLIDSGFLSHRTGWYNGDFNYDGTVNGSDYTLIDNAFNTQGAQILSEVASPTSQVSGVSAVPEPASLSLLGIGAVGLLGRRKRHR